MDARLTEAWSLSASVQRQAGSLRLSFGTPDISANERRQRKQLWVALLYQDHVLSCLLEVPRSLAGHSNGTISEANPKTPHSADSDPDDRYCSALYEITACAEAHVLPFLGPFSRESSATEYTRVAGVLQSVYHAVGAPFRELDSVWVEEQSNDRIRRQGIELLCNFHFHSILLAHKDMHFTSEMTDNIRRIIDSARESLAAFFVLVEKDQDTTAVWNLTHTLCYFQVVCHNTMSRSTFTDLSAAFRQVMIGTILCHMSCDRSELASRRRDPVLMLAKSDFDRYLDTLIRGSPPSTTDNVSANRINQLRELRKEIKIS
jgi:hypothetical protein